MATGQTEIPGVSPALMAQLEERTQTGAPREPGNY